MNKKKILVGLDRDGTINYDTGYFGKDDSWEEKLKIYSGVIEGIKNLNQNPLIKIIVATNQAGVARGYYDCERIEEINNYIDEIFKSNKALVEGWYYCPFVSKEYAKEKNIPSENNWVRETDMRKPGIGMLKKACNNLGLNLEDLKVYFIGDKKSDVETGLNCNGKGILIPNKGIGSDFKKVEEMRKNYPKRVFIAPNFLEACRIVLSNTKF